MKPFIGILSSVSFLALVAVAAAADDGDKAARTQKDKAASPRAGQVKSLNVQQAKRFVENWPEASRGPARAMIDKYGAPDGVTDDMLVWNETGPFLRTIVYKEPVDHDFPVPHKDVLEQFVRYDIVPERMDELTAYDGSVIAERTKGELSARCDKEGANILALNLADGVLQGRLTVEQARAQYADAIARSLRGEKPEMMTELRFDQPTRTAARDSDVAVLKARAAERTEPERRGEAQEDDGAAREER